MNSSFTARWNEALIDDNYELWRHNPASVSEDWSAFFEGFELGCAKPQKNGAAPAATVAAPTTTAANVGLANASLETRVEALVYFFRTLGHFEAKLDPLAATEMPASGVPALNAEELGFSAADLDKTVTSRFFRDARPMKLRDMIEELRGIYCDTIGAEFMHIQNPIIRNWVLEKLENRSDWAKRDAPVQKDILRKLVKSEEFERFLHTKYQGNKRFSLEGGEALVVALEVVLKNCPKHGIKEIVMGMAHRGRLNVLANFLHKPLALIFNEFSENYVPKSVGGSGDVKYHLGYQATRHPADGYNVDIHLAANPSHLEAVDPVVQGKARARQRVLGDTEERKSVLPLLVHGDAAFIGQGVVAEVFNLSQLPGYRTGGTVHIVVNNQIGFTTLPKDGRSSHYCTDIAKMVDAPIFHVNGEDALAVLQVTEFATEFRQTFGRDVVIDIYCYRRHGHNELDEPTFTQPTLYKSIGEHRLLSDIFTAEILALGAVTQEEIDRIKTETLSELETALAQVKEKQQEKNAPTEAVKKELAGSTAIFQAPYSHEPVDTAISAAMLEQIATALTTLPPGFRILPKLKRIIIDRRQKVWKDGGPYDWSFAEALAFGSLLLEKTPVRLSGQDSRRGTFSHRLSVIYDEVSRDRHIPLNHLTPNPDDQAKYCVYNSPLSEYAVLGFDYGYSMDYPSMLCLWEAQFGDFGNGAQIIIDQFIASAESKWQRPSSIVMLLPHGYEGQGPEHSSARLERFLQLCAEENMQVCNVSTPAQYFHVLRRQIHNEYRKPLIIMTPKSLLRAEAAVSKAEEFTNSRFYEILDDPTKPDPKKVDRVILCSGKVYYDLEAHRTANADGKTAIIRIEQFYPLYREKLKRIVAPYKHAKSIVWCQEEPQNMGAWFFLAYQLADLLEKPIKYAGRVPAASPATGSTAMHKKQQAALVKDAFTL